MLLQYVSNHSAAANGSAAMSRACSLFLIDKPIFAGSPPVYSKTWGSPRSCRLIETHKDRDAATNASPPSPPPPEFTPAPVSTPPSSSADAEDEAFSPVPPAPAAGATTPDGGTTPGWRGRLPFRSSVWSTLEEESSSCAGRRGVQGSGAGVGEVVVRESGGVICLVPIAASLSLSSLHFSLLCAGGVGS